MVAHQNVRESGARKSGNAMYLVALFCFCLPSLLMVIVPNEYWPFSAYDMYAKKIPAQYLSYQISLLVREGVYQPIRDMDAIFPLGPHCLNNCLNALLSGPNAAETRLKQLLLYYLDRCRERPQICHMDEKKEILGIALFRTKVFKPSADDPNFKESIDLKLYEITKSN